MGKALRIYYNALFGGLGGLLGWVLFGVLVPPDRDWQSQALFGGLLIGGLIGFWVVSVDALVDASLVRFARHAALGTVLGAAGGAVGFFCGEGLNYAIVNYVIVALGGASDSTWANLLKVLARGGGWMLFGLAVGIGEGIAARSLNKLSYGTVGGAVGGFLGGCIFGSLMLRFDRLEDSYVWGQALGLILLGACIGSLIAVVEEVFKPAAVKVLRGWQEGREYPLHKPVTVLGRDESADILLLRDMKVERRHAQIRREGGRFLFVNTNAPAATTRVNDTPIPDVTELQDGDRIQLGDVVLRFLCRAPRPQAIPRHRGAASAPHRDGGQGS
jgi:hypothetical protein